MGTDKWRVFLNQISLQNKGKAHFSGKRCGLEANLEYKNMSKSLYIQLVACQKEIFNLG